MKIENEHLILFAFDNYNHLYLTPMVAKHKSLYHNAW